MTSVDYGGLFPAVGGRNRHCGPAALAALDGCDLEQATAVLRRVKGGGPVHGVHYCQLQTAFWIMGRHLVDVPRVRGTIASWARSAVPGRYLVGTSRHWVAVAVVNGSEVWVCDNGSKYPVRLETFRRRLGRVRMVGRVE